MRTAFALFFSLHLLLDFIQKLLLSAFVILGSKIGLLDLLDLRDSFILQSIDQLSVYWMTSLVIISLYILFLVITFVYLSKIPQSETLESILTYNKWIPVAYVCIYALSYLSSFVIYIQLMRHKYSTLNVKQDYYWTLSTKSSVSPNFYRPCLDGVTSLQKLCQCRESANDFCSNDFDQRSTYLFFILELTIYLMVYTSSILPFGMLSYKICALIWRNKKAKTSAAKTSELNSLPMTVIS